jgi:hypothetical protein
MVAGWWWWWVDRMMPKGFSRKGNLAFSIHPSFIHSADVY